MKSKLFYFGLSGITNSGKTAILENIFNNKDFIIEKLKHYVFNNKYSNNEIENMLNISFENKKFLSKILALQLNEIEKQKIMNNYYHDFDKISVSKFINISDQSIGSTIAYNYINLIDQNYKKIDTNFISFQNDINNYISSFSNIFNTYDVYINIYRINRDTKETLKHISSDEEIYFGNLNILKSIDLNLDILSSTIKKVKYLKKLL